LATIQRKNFMQKSQSRELFEQALKIIPGGVNSPVRAFRAVGGNPFFAASARGAYLQDVDGQSYVDYVCTWGPSILGHASAEVLEALREAMVKGTSFGVPGPLEVEMAKKVTQAVASVEKVRMCNSGTEATMSSIRLARGYTKRDRIIKFDGCFHGHVDSLLVKAGSGALTLGCPDSAGIPAAVAADTICLPFNDLEAFSKVMKEMGDAIAAVILEPIPANAGLILPDPEFLCLLRKETERLGIVLIFDEVMTGFRLGRGGAQEILGIRPDLSAFGKVIGGGLPVGAFGGKAEIMDCLAPLGPVYQAGTLSGNPLAMAAGCAQLDVLWKENGFERLEKIGVRLESLFREAIASSRLPLSFTRVGSMFCLYFTTQKIRNLDDVKTADLEMFRRYFHQMLDRGVYVPPSQFETCFLSLAHGEEELEKTAEALRFALCN
jgi:glutamate-1-semialdehyde 2,1-aminomutase